MTGTILVTSRSFSTGRIDVASRLTDAGYEIVTASHRHSIVELAPLLGQVVAWIAGTGPVTAEHLALAPRLRVIARYGVGFDAVDLDAASARGVLVTNTPGANSDSVANLALAHLLASLRTVTSGNRAVRDGDWSAIRGREIASLRVGVAGFGRIGRSFAACVSALGATVRIYDPFLAPGMDLPAGMSLAAEFGELAECDAVSLHAPGGQRLVTAEWLAGARGLALVNTARGDLVDERAIADALRSGSLASYAADTLDSESVSSESSALFAPDLADRVTITPHLGAQTIDAVDRMGAVATDDALRVLRGEEPLHAVAPVSFLRKAIT